ncbi:TPA: hypothetical protein EYP27_01075 [Candidatus Bathyarchaeota archaeon]|nr:hypothetical protein [Candidatus Bathyarchaeota archaeon]
MTLDRNILFNIILAVLIFITVPSMAALGANSLDIYVSVFTLEYFACMAVFRPRRRTLDFIAIALFAAFSVIVGLKVWEILV